jgi:hypothetical protein
VAKKRSTSSSHGRSGSPSSRFAARHHEGPPQEVADVLQHFDRVRVVGPALNEAILGRRVSARLFRIDTPGWQRYDEAIRA